VRVVARAHKMSKSRGNVVNPDDVVAQYGADSLRLYEMFMGPLRDTKARGAVGTAGGWGMAAWWCLAGAGGLPAWQQRRQQRAALPSPRARGPPAAHLPTRPPARPPAPRAGVEHAQRGGRAPLPGARVPRL
jgi:hypothetical protein